ncbi:hypothetical protein LCGC14_1351310 [marine sediment metagenome]|uniref:Uncharacterized protein n=1 Tax=marine sediment metagenome TaxID=412755 RepID=A0A0F9KX24_9ZZZZ
MIMWAAWANATFILLAVWVLAGGKVRPGNWLSIGACVAGAYLNVMLELWPMVGLAAILFGRSSWVLWGRRRSHG